ncbi:MAG: hypothetical protein AAGU25_06225 [bacterium]|jgi:hypothetical protein
MKKFFVKPTLDQIRLVILIIVVALFIIGAGAPAAIGGIGGNSADSTSFLPLW